MVDEEKKLREDIEKAKDAALKKKPAAGASAPKPATAPQKGRFKEKIKAFGAGIKSTGKKVKDVAGIKIPNLVLLILLVFIAAFDYWMKSLFGFEAVSAFVMSSITAFLFLMVLKNKIPFILLGIDVGILLILTYLPAWGVFDFLILIKMFVWLVFSIVIFVYYLVETLNLHEKVPAIAWAFVIILFTIGIFFSGPLVKDLYAEEVLSHQDRYEEAFEQVEKVKEAAVEQANVSASFWKRWGTAFPYLVKGDLDTYKEILNPTKNLTIAGEIDQTIEEYTKVELKKSELFPEQVQKDITPRLSIPFNIEIDSPFKEITIKLSCKFKKAKQEFTGYIEPVDLSEFTIKTQRKETETISCTPDQEYEKGKYKVEMIAEISRVKTESSLKRLFTGKTLTSKEKQEAKITYDFKKEKQLSTSGEEFAAFSFGAGAPIDSIFIGNKEKILLAGGIQNLASGEIIYVDKITIELPEGLTPVQECGKFRIAGNQLILEERLGKLTGIKEKDTLPLLSCYLSVPIDLKEIQLDYQKRKFKAYMDYSYRIKQEEDFTVIEATG